MKGEIKNDIVLHDDLFEINEYIEKKLNFNTDLLSQFIQFCTYIKNNNIELTEEKVIKIITTNNMFNNLLQNIFVLYKELINREQLTTHPVALYIIDTYILINNLEEKKELNIKDLDLKNYDDNFKIFMNEIGQYKTLTTEEIKILKSKMAEGDKRARELIINSNLKLVVKVAMTYQNCGLDLLDLIQEGTFGLMKSVESFEPSLGFRFSTYATRGIRTSILRAIENTSRNIRIPAQLSYDISKYKKKVREFVLLNGRELSIDELVQLTELEKSKILEYQKYAVDTVSYNTIITNLNNERDTELMELIPDDVEEIDKNILTDEINDDLNKLFKAVGFTDREIDILSLYFGLKGNTPITKKDIGVKYKLTRERVRQIIEKLLRKLRTSNKICEFSIYMDDPKTALENIESFKKIYKKTYNPNKKVRINQ